MRLHGGVGICVFNLVAALLASFCVEPFVVVADVTALGGDSLPAALRTVTA